MHIQLDTFNKRLEGDKAKYANGPISKRSCTDCLCCLFFIVALIGFAAASAYGWFNGDPRKLLIGWDTDGRGCGFTSAVEDYPALYWARPPAGDDLKAAIEKFDTDAVLDLLNTGVCVKECPDADPATVVDCALTETMKNSADFTGCTF